MSIIKQQVPIVEQKQIAKDIYSLWFECPKMAKQVRAGQFVNVFVGDGAKLLPRPISICEVKGSKIRLVYRVTSIYSGTKYISQLQKGDSIEVMGTLGNGFPLSLAQMKEDRYWNANPKPHDTDIVIVGGGIGIPPLKELAKTFQGKCKIILGYRDKETFLAEEFQEITDQIYIATDDGSVGYHGNVWEAMQYYQAYASVCLACGPNPMLWSLKNGAKQRGMEAYLSVEGRMACGIGACLSCICDANTRNPNLNVSNFRICKEGPVFKADILAEEFLLGRG